MTTLDQFHALRGAACSRLLADVRELQPTAGTTISVATRLRAENHYPPDLVAAAMTLHELRGRAGGKFSRASDMWFTRPGLEQATGEHIARWRARRFDGYDTVADLCCGIGGDLIALAAPVGRQVIAVDRDPLHSAMAVANAEVYACGAEIDDRVASVEDVGLDAGTAVFVDPARRTDRGRMTGGTSEPPVAWAVALAANGRPVGIKAAPGIDPSEFPANWEVEFIADGHDLKEAVLWSPALATVPHRATVMFGHIAHTLSAVAGDPVGVGAPEPGAWLVDPNPAVTRAGLVEDLARTIGARKIDERIAFLVSSAPLDSPFGRALPIVASLPWNERLLKTRLRELGIGPVDIRRRGLAGDVDAISRRLRGREGRPATIAMTRVQDQPWAIICESSQIEGGTS